MIVDTEKLITLAHYAEMCNIQRATAWVRAKKGHIKVVNIDGFMYVNVDEAKIFKDTRGRKCKE